MVRKRRGKRQKKWERIHVVGCLYQNNIDDDNDDEDADGDDTFLNKS